MSSPGAEGLDVDGAELLQPLLMRLSVCQRLHVCWGAGVREGGVVLLAPAGAARPRHAVLAGEGGASRRVILQPRIQVALLVILLVHELVVLRTREEKEQHQQSEPESKESPKNIYDIYNICIYDYVLHIAWCSASLCQ